LIHDKRQETSGPWRNKKTAFPQIMINLRIKTRGPFGNCVNRFRFLKKDDVRGRENNQWDSIEKGYFRKSSG